MKFGFSLFFHLVFCKVAAQPPIGQWREHMPYNTGINVCELNNRIYCATDKSVFYIEKEDNSVQTLSRVNGLAETGITTMKKNEFNNSILIGFQNSNINILKKNNTIVTLNDIKRKNIVGDKRIYNFYSTNHTTYVCTGFGIVAIDEERLETKETYYIGNSGGFLRVNNLAILNNFIYAATTEGLKRASLNSNLSNFSNWINISGTSNLSAGAIDNIFTFNNKLAAQKNDSVFQLNGSQWSLLYASATPIIQTSVSDNKLFIIENVVGSGTRIQQIEPNGIVSNTLRQNNLPESAKDIIKSNQQYWIADFFKGLYLFENSNFTLFKPSSPQSIASGELYFDKEILYAAAGNVNDAWNYTFNPNGILQFENNSWSPIWKFNFPAMDTMLDFITITTKRNGEVYAGSYGGGLLKISNNTTRVYKQNSALENAIGDPGSYRVSGLAVDDDQNVWVSNYGTPQPLKVLKPNETWQSFAFPFFIPDNAVSQIVIDPLNQKWIVSPKGGGLICFSHGNSIDNTSDDRYRLFKLGNGNGNLPSNDVYCLTKDKDGILWIGTAKGIALVQCIDNVFTNNCEAVLPIVQQDQFAGFLFQNEFVQTIAVDGANRKWVGTKNGVWLINEGGEKIVYRFSEDNSPLLSNDVKKIAIHPTTGEVFFATALGICSFRSTATQPADNIVTLKIFPNPVPAHFNGLIGISGLQSNSIVKITELNGRLVFQTKSLGGQAVWNGRNYKNEKIHSGTYLVLVTDEESNEKIAGKIFFVGK